MSPAPTSHHQRVSRRLANLLESAAEAAGADVEVFETVNVEMSESLLIPDVIVTPLEFSAEGNHRTFPPEFVILAVEIVSPSSRRMDRMLKPGVYFDAGVPHFWRVELDPRLLVAYARADSGYVEVARAEPGRPCDLELPFPVTVDVAALLAPPRRSSG